MTRTSTISQTSQNSHPQWAVLVYQAADNNLTEECIYALTEMKAAKASTSRALARETDVVVRLDPVGIGTPSRLFNLSAKKTLEEDEDLRQRRTEIDTGDPQTLLDFLCDAINKSEADYFMLVLSGHGSGATEGFFLKDEERPLLSIPSSFPVPALRSVFRAPRLKDALGDRKINILGFDACMMSVVEVCYQLKDIDVLELVVGAEGFSLNSGWPLRSIIEHIRGNAVSPNELANHIVKAHVRFYSDYYLGGLSVDQSAIDLSKIVKLREEIDRLACSMIDQIREERKSEEKSKKRHYVETGKPFQDALLLAHWAAQSYNGEQCVDLYDFCDLLQKRVPADKSADSVWNCCNRLKNFLKPGETKLIRKTCFAGSAFQYSHGISIYFPWGFFDLARSYRELDFAKQSRWLTFLRIYLRYTRRRPRRKGVELSERFRSTPPTSKGPAGRIFSMRNPPISFFRSECEMEKKSSATKAKLPSMSNGSTKKSSRKTRR